MRALHSPRGLAFAILAAASAGCVLRVFPAEDGLSAPTDAAVALDADADAPDGDASDGGRPPVTLSTLHGVPVPEPAALAEFVADRAAAIVLGKAFFWDQQAGSDGQACASCHFHAGADSRARHQLAPGLSERKGMGAFDPTATGAAGGPNYVLKAKDFPFHRLEDGADRDGTVTFDSDDVVSSQGTYAARFVSIGPGQDDVCAPGEATAFRVGGVELRQVQFRNTPTVINAVFNERNLWDGRASVEFNGKSPFGPRDTRGELFEATADGVLVPLRVALRPASLASQATGPLLNPAEMSCAGRAFTDVARKLLGRRPLLEQAVHAHDSVLGPYRHGSGAGLAITYQDLVRKAFQPRLWRSGARTPAGASQMEANFSLFWGVAIQLYESTLVSDDAPVDRFLRGNEAALTVEEKAGLAVFTGRGRCAFCHSGPAFTAAARLDRGATAVDRMVLGDGAIALYDRGVYNIGVRPTDEDRGAGGSVLGFPISFARQAKLAAGGTAIPDLFPVIPADFRARPGEPVHEAERDAADGAFKVPTLRNVELTGPYFHNGGHATLEQVIDFYDRGGDRRRTATGDTSGYESAPSNADPGLAPLRLTAAEKASLVAFLRALTDERVRYERAPFDHPALRVPEGVETAAGGAVQCLADGRPVERVRELPAVGAEGAKAPLRPFTPDP